MAYVGRSPDDVTLRVSKSADETVNNSASYQDDDHLSLPVKGGVRYKFKSVLWVESGTTEKIKARYRVDGSQTLTGIQNTRFLIGTNTFTEYGCNSQTGSTHFSALGLDTTGTSNECAIIEGFFEASGDCNFILEWAQLTSGATDTKVKKGSYLEVTPME